MPRCELTRSFLERITHTKHLRKTAYLDADMRGLMLEFRPSGRGTWYFRGKGKDGRWRLIWLGNHPGMDLLEARDQAYDLYKMVRREGSLDAQESPHDGKMSLRAFASKHYLPHAKIRKRSWEIEAGMLRRHILPHLGRMGLSGLTRHGLYRWQEGLLEKGLSPSTCNRVLFLLKYMLNCARRWGFLEKSPAKDVRPLRERDYRARFLSEEEARHLLNVLESEKHTMAAQVIRLLLFTGARKSEILSARWEYVDIARRMLTVPISKSGRARHIPLSDAALDVLAEMPRSSEWLFPSPRKDTHIKSYFDTWKKIRVRAGLEDVRVHDLRHSFASFLVNSGCSLYEVQKILGHRDPKVTTRYAHLTLDSLLQATNLAQKNIRKKTVKERNDCHSVVKKKKG